MTVLYTTNLALGQPVTGTESGTWGEDVNNSVTSYLDIAISGTLSLTSASFTANALLLANTNGNSSATNIGSTTAQYYVLKLSSLAANVAITAPSVSKTYLVVNADATYSVIIKASGQTGVTVVAGERATVYYNAATLDYIKVTSNVASNLTGTLPVANGGTGLTSTPANGALDIGNGTGFTRATLTAGSNISITNTAGGISIASSNPGGTITSVTGTAPVVSSGGTAPAISMAAASSGVNGYMTGTYATKLDGIATGATNVTNNNQITNGAGYITSSGSISGNAATATNPQAGGTFITSSNIASQSVASATNATNATRITNSGGWNVTPSGTKLYFNYNGTNVGSLDSSGNFLVIGNVTAYGTVT